jgi:PIN domain nuclease of toxin-antitoxin system
LLEERIGARIRDALIDPDVTAYVSVASLWEIAIKFRLGKLALDVPLGGLPTLIEAARLALLRIEASHVLAAVDPQPPTRDPFDRLLLAQCAVEQLYLVTTDRQLLAHPLAWRPA